MRCATPNVTSTMWFIEIGKCCEVMSSASASEMPMTVVAERRGKRTMRRATMRVLPSRLRAAFSMPCAQTTEAHGRRRRERRGRRQLRGAIHGLSGAQYCRDERHDDRPEIHIDLGVEAEAGNPIDRRVDLRHVGADPAADQRAERSAEQRERDRELAVVKRDRGIAVAERLEQPDVRALGGDEPRQRDVQQEHRDQHEDRRQDRGHRPQRGQFVRQKLRRQHAIARVGAASAVPREELRRSRRSCRVRSPPARDETRRR